MMIPNHKPFVEAIQEKKKVCVRYYSKADSGVLDRVCAPMDYGPGGGNQDGLSRHLLRDYASNTESHLLGLVPLQITDMHVLTEMLGADRAFGKGRKSQASASRGHGFLENAGDATMYTLKLICLTIIQLFKQAWSFPNTVIEAVKQRKRETVLDQLEIERLDRIRNPSKYLGK